MDFIHQPPDEKVIKNRKECEEQNEDYYNPHSNHVVKKGF